MIGLNRGRLFCAEPEEQRKLAATLERARLGGGQNAVLLLGRDGRRWSFRVQRWPRHPEIALAFVAIISPLEYFEEPSPDWLRMMRDLFGLSPAEARIASLVGQGLAVPEIGDRLSIGAGTVRNQLKAVFAKGGVARQTELSVLLSRL